MSLDIILVWAIMDSIGDKNMNTPTTGTPTPVTVTVNDYEAFQAEWAEWENLVQDSTPLERAPEDFIREAQEGEQDIERLCEEWDKFWLRFDFPFAE